LRQQVDRQQPSGQRQFGARERGLGGHGGLPPAAMALEQPAPEHTVARVRAFGTDEASRPAPGEQRPLALRLGPEAAQTFTQTQALLKLHPVSRHRLSPCEIRRCQSATTPGSRAEPHG
jgi:hypothetical protein